MFKDIYLNTIYVENMIMIFINVLTLINKYILSNKNSNIDIHKKRITDFFIVSVLFYVILFYNPFYSEDVILNSLERKQLFISSILILLNYIIK